MIRLPPRAARTDTLIPYTTRVRSQGVIICGYLVAVVSGYILHSTWSFRGHGAAATQTSWRFFLVSLVSYAMNAFWVRLLTDDARSAERRVGTERVSTCRSRWPPIL